LNFYQSSIEKLDKGFLGFGLFIDLKKAFDTVDHQILLKKLERYGVCGPVLEWFKDYLSGRQQYIKVNGKRSNPKTVLCGVPQGSILGPLLFIIYVNDLPDVLDKLEATIFADDTTMVSYAKDIETLEVTANQELKTVASWFRKNKLTFNAKKTYYLVFSHEQCHKLRKINIEINGNQIEQKDKIKHLGVIFHEHLRWHGHINHVLSKVLKYMPVFYYIRRYVTRKTLMTIYNSFIYPHLIYCAIVWGNRIQNEGVIDRLLVFQKKLSRIMTFAPLLQGPKEHTEPLMRHLKMLNIQEVIRYKTLCFVHGLLNGRYPTVNLQMIYADKLESVKTRLHDKKKLYTTSYLTSMGYRGVQSALQHTWNFLPYGLRNKDEESTFVFKKLMKKYITATNEIGTALNCHLPIKCRQNSCCYEYCNFCTPIGQFKAIMNVTN
jgi:hypothetical protein